jgi:3',5'-cyclic AMP phosphodiesterase CpdA
MKLLVVSDLHFAGEREQSRRGHEARVMPNRLTRNLAHLWRHHCWLRDPFAHNHRLAAIMAAVPAPDLVVANGDFTLDTGFIGVSDGAALESAALALGQLRARYGDRLLATIGDHELGKKSLFGEAGGPRIESLRRCEQDLGLNQFWRRQLGRTVLLGMASTPLAWPVFEPEALPTELAQWRAVHTQLTSLVTAEFEALPADARLILFVHDPTALSFLWALPAVKARVQQIEHTIIGHLHTPIILRWARRLAGMPQLNRFGVTARRLSSALNRARCWREFKVSLCPSPSGCQLLKDGGWLELEIDDVGGGRTKLTRKHLPWSRATPP